MGIETHVWGPSQTEEALHLFSRAMATTLPGYEPGRLLMRLQDSQELLADGAKVFLEAFMGRFQSPFKYDKTNDGWELVRPVEGVDWREWPADPTATGPTVPADWELIRIPELFEVVSFVRGRETSVNGLEMRQRAVDPAQCDCPDGQHAAEWLLDNQQYIPMSLRNYYLPFPGTIWRNGDGALIVPCLCWGSGLWRLDFYWLNRFWGACRRLLRRRDSSV